MPNWCENKMSVSGPKEDVKAFDEKLKGLPAKFSDDPPELEEPKFTYCLNALYPVPQEVRDAGFSTAGYNWCADNWGTKWDIDMKDAEYEDVDDSRGLATYAFDTAWAPPVGWLSHVVAQFKHLNFALAFVEPGSMVAGVYEAYKGVVSMTTCHEGVDAEDEINEFCLDYFGYAPFEDEEEEKDAEE